MASNALRPISRYITTNTPSGKAIFTDDSTTSPATTTPTNMTLHFGYGTKTLPANFTHNQDLISYHSLIANPPGLVIPGGTSARIVDMPPGFESEMHMTPTLNFNFVIEGEVEVLLSGGEVRRLRRGDMLVQRAVEHRWRNVSGREWARVAAVMLPGVVGDEHSK